MLHVPMLCYVLVDEDTFTRERAMHTACVHDFTKHR